MADGGISTWFRLVLDRASVRRVADGVRAGMKDAGRRGGDEAVKAIRQQFDRRMADAREELARGLIDRKTFERRSREAAQAFNRGILREIQRLGDAGRLTDKRFIGLTKRLKDVGTTGERSFRSLRSAVATALPVALFTAGAMALRSLARWAGEALRAIERLGDELSRAQGLRASFDALAERIGTTSDVLLPRLRKAVRYTIEDQELFALANQAVQLGVAENADDLETLAFVARRLGRAMGGETLKSVGDLTIALGRASSRVLDNLGIMLRETEAQRIYAAQIGKTADELSEEEKQVAFLTIALQRARKAAESMGEEEVKAGERIQQAASAVRTFRTAALEAVAESPKIRSLFEGIGTWAESSADKVDLLAARVGAFVDAVLETPGVDTFFRLLAGEFRLLGRAAGMAMSVGPGSFGERYQRNLSRRVAGDAVALPPPYAPGGTTETEEERRAREELERQKRAEALQQEIQLLARGYELRTLSARELSRVYELERELSRQLSAGNLSLERRNEIAGHLGTLRGVMVAEGSREMRPRLAGGRQQVGTGKAIGAVNIPGFGLDEERRAELLADVWMQANADILAAGQSTAYGVAGAWQDAFGLMFEGFENIGAAAEALGRGIGGALLGGLAQYASSKIAENIALMFEEIAKGQAAAASVFLAPTAPGHFAAAKAHGVAALKWSVLAGAAGAAQSAVAGGGRGGRSGGIPSGATDIGGRLAEQSSGGPEVHIYIDPLDPHNPAYQRNAYAAVGYAKERYGEDASVHIHPRTGRS